MPVMSVRIVFSIFVFVFLMHGYVTQKMEDRLEDWDQEYIDESPGYTRDNLGDGELSDRVVIQSTRNEDPAVWFDKEHPAFKYLDQLILDNERYIIARIRKTRRKRSIHRTIEDNDVEKLRHHPQITFVQQEVARVRKVRTLDPEWTNLWHLNGDVTPSMRIEDVWAAGYSGKGITVAVVDDGFQYNHVDLAANADTNNDIDIYEADNDPYPPSSDSSHGTQVGGLIAAVKDNNICIVGAAFNATLIGIRILGTFTISDSEEAAALMHYRDGIDIYSNSWGPTDGTGFSNPGIITQKALKDGVILGRNGKGSIYLFAAGNGGVNDNCNADGYVNSIYTIAVTSVEKSQNAWYAEVCAAALTAAYGGSEDDRYLTTTTTFSQCKSSGIQGTSYSTPIVSGIIALTLEANNELTWRDIQHLIVWSSSRQGFNDTYSNWTVNGVGKEVSQVMGFGLIDAKKMVDEGKAWSTVPVQLSCSIDAGTLNSPTISDTMLITSTDCSSIRFLEHVLVDVKFSYSSLRGVTEIYITSPSGTKSHILHYRYTDAVDNAPAGTHTWQFMSVHFWWENPLGVWTLEISSALSFVDVYINEWNITLYGTETDPRPANIETTSEFKTSKEETSSVAALSTGESLTTTIAALTTSETVTTTVVAPTAMKTVTTTGTLPINNESVTTTVAAPTTSETVAITVATSTTGESMTATGASSVTSESLTTTEAEPTISESLTTTIAAMTTSETVKTTVAAPTAIKTVTTTGTLPITSESVTTTEAAPTTNESVAITVATSTTGESMTTTGAASVTSESLTTTMPTQTTIESVTRTVPISTTNESTTTDAQTTSATLTTELTVPTSSESTSTYFADPTNNESATEDVSVSINNESSSTKVDSPSAVTVPNMSETTVIKKFTDSLTTSVAENNTYESFTASLSEQTTLKALFTTTNENTNYEPSITAVNEPTTTEYRLTTHGLTTSELLKTTTDEAVATLTSEVTTKTDELSTIVAEQTSLLTTATDSYSIATTNQASSNDPIVNESFQSSAPLVAGGTAAAVSIVSLFAAVAVCVLATKGFQGNTIGQNNSSVRSGNRNDSSQKSTAASEGFSTTSFPKHWKSEFNPRNMARFTGHTWD